MDKPYWLLDLACPWNGTVQHPHPVLLTGNTDTVLADCGYPGSLERLPAAGISVSTAGLGRGTADDEEVFGTMSVYFYGCATLDGYLATRDHGLDWLHQTGTVEDTGYEDFYARMDVTLMGRRTFREVERLGNPAEVYPTTENYVFTHGPLDQEGFTAASGDPAAFVERLGREKNIWVIGGNTVLAPLLDRDLVDHLDLQVAPVLLGAGIPLFTQREALRRLRLEAVRQYGPFAELVYGRP